MVGWFGPQNLIAFSNASDGVSGRLRIAAIAFALVVTASLAAVSGGDDRSEATGDVGPTGTFAFEEPVELPPCDTSGELRSCTLAKEPTFDVGPDGEIWMTGAGAVGLTSQVWYSPDLGDTWRHIGFQGGDAGRHTTGAEGDVAVDPLGTAYVFDTNLYQGWWSIFEDPLLPPTTIPFAAVKSPVQRHPEGFLGYYTTGPTDDFDRPWLVSLGPDEIFFSYNNGHTSYRITRDGGVTWSPVVTVSHDCNLGRPLELGPDRFAFVSACLTGSLGSGGEITWSSAPTLFVPKRPVEPSVLEDERPAWRSVPVVTPIHDGSGEEVARDALPIMDLVRTNGTWFVVGADRPRHRSYLSWRALNGTWSTTWLGPGDRSWFPSVAARADGAVGVAYASRENGTWGVRAELRDPDGSLRASTVVDPGPVAPDTSSLRGAMGDFINVGWLPDNRLMVAYGHGPGSEPLFEDASRIRVARSEPIIG